MSLNGQTPLEDFVCLACKRSRCTACDVLRGCEHIGRYDHRCRVVVLCAALMPTEEDA